MAVVDGAGQTVLPGLWEMHIHFSGVEFGPALLAAGIMATVVYALGHTGDFAGVLTERLASFGPARNEP